MATSSREAIDPHHQQRVPRPPLCKARERLGRSRLPQRDLSPTINLQPSARSALSWADVPCSSAETRA